jgi:hypothetical protein
LKIQHREPHGPLRAAAYPPITEQLDAIFKLAEHLKDQGQTMPPAVMDWIAKCRAVKNRYPKA